MSDSPQSPARRSEVDLAELRNHPVLMHVDEVLLEQVHSATRLVRLDAKQHLFHQNQPANHFYLLHSGRIKLYRVSPDGDEKVIEIIAPGDSFAEAVMFMREHAYPVHAMALVSSDVIAIPNRPVLEVLETSTEACFQLMRGLSTRLREKVAEIGALALQNAGLRLVNYIMQLVPVGATTPQLVELPAAKQVVAARLSIQPETLSRLLSQLESNGVITVSGRQLHVLDVERLRNIALGAPIYRSEAKT